MRRAAKQAHTSQHHMQPLRERVTRVGHRRPHEPYRPLDGIGMPRCHQHLLQLLPDGILAAAQLQAHANAFVEEALRRGREGTAWRGFKTRKKNMRFL